MIRFASVTASLDVAPGTMAVRAPKYAASRLRLRTMFILANFMHVKMISNKMLAMIANSTADARDAIDRDGDEFVIFCGTDVGWWHADES